MSDVLCYDDLDEFGRDLDDPLAELGQDVVHQLLESFGSNADATERSIALEDALSGTFSASGLRHRIETKLGDDPRIVAASATIEKISDSQSGAVYAVKIAIQANEGELGITLTFDGAGNVVSTS